MTEERRNSRRKNVLKIGVVESEGASATECLVWNASDGGAMIEVEPSLELPRSVTLTYPDNPNRPCAVIWQQDRRAGVSSGALSESQAKEPETELN